MLLYSGSVLSADTGRTLFVLLALVLLLMLPLLRLRFQAFVALFSVGSQSVPHYLILSHK